MREVLQTMNEVVGVDVSTKAIAFVTLDGDRARYQLVSVSKKSAPTFQRMRELADAARTFFEQQEPALVYVEEAPMGRSFRSSLVVGYVVGCVILEAMRAGHLVVPVNTMTWRKQTVGSGKADKLQIKEWATRYVLIPGGITDLPKEQDVYDAACIAAFARKNLP